MPTFWINCKKYSRFAIEVVCLGGSACSDKKVKLGVRLQRPVKFSMADTR